MAHPASTVSVFERRKDGVIPDPQIAFEIVPRAEDGRNSKSGSCGLTRSSRAAIGEVLLKL
jgi:hypothetical protein